MFKRFTTLEFKRIFPVITLIVLIDVTAAYAQSNASLSMQETIDLAVSNDDWIVANEQRENSLRQEAIFTGQLPDPKMTVGLANLPIDTLDFNQEPMTQFKVGVSQTFPRGDSLALGQEQKIQQSEANPYLREDRKASVAMQVSKIWLQSYLAQETIALINADRALFEQLVEITNTRYRTAAGNARQQDVVRAELELTRLEERLAFQKQKLNAQKQQLAQWVPSEYLNLPLSTELQKIEITEIELVNLAQASEVFVIHPRVQAIEKQIEAANTGVELARQSYKPAYSVGANYGYRDNGPMGMSRDDFVSLEVSFDLPFFTEKRQKPKVEAAAYTAASVQTERTLLFRNIFSNYQSATAELHALDERKSIFENVLLIQMNELTESTLAAYTSDEGDFEEVMRAYIAELNAKIEFQGIEIERQKILATLKYFLTESVVDEGDLR